MLTNKHLFEELRKVEEQIKQVETTDPVQAAQLKVATLAVKLLHNLRTNMVAIMRHYGIKLVPSGRKGHGEEEAGE